MSDAAKSLLVTLGSRFSDTEYKNARNLENNLGADDKKSDGPKLSFWKRSGNKVPGRKLDKKTWQALHKGRPVKTLGRVNSVDDVWEENEQDRIKVANLTFPSETSHTLQALRRRQRCFLNALRASPLGGYVPSHLARRELVLQNKREEYHCLVKEYFPTRFEDNNADIYRQIHIDIPRTKPLIPLFQQEVVQQVGTRRFHYKLACCLNESSTSGLCDILRAVTFRESTTLVTPFFITFLSPHSQGTPETFDATRISLDVLADVEADTFWLLSRLLEGIQDDYTFAQPGIQNKINSLKYLVQRVDAALNAHIINHGIDYLQFAFRWMNNLLMRELPLNCTIRLWDTYWETMLFLQNLPTLHWTDTEIALLVAGAYKLQFVFADAPKHLKS